MSIVAVVSSPVKGNTDALVSAMAEGARENGKKVEIFHLNSLSNKMGCQACMGCKKAGHCVVQDDLTPIIDAMRKAEGIIVSSPVYFGVACGQYRLLEDRFFGFINADFTPNVEAGKKVAIVTAAGSHGAEELANGMASVMQRVFGCEIVGKMAVVSHSDPYFSANNPALLAQAKEIGKKF